LLPPICRILPQRKKRKHLQGALGAVGPVCSGARVSRSGLWPGSRWAGSNRWPAVYKKYGPVHRAGCLHGYHGAVSLRALIAPFAW